MGDWTNTPVGDWTNGGYVDSFIFWCDELGLVLWGVGLILRNECERQEQNYTALFQESEMSVVLHSWSLS